jgi:hypothetical protein
MTVERSPRRCRIGVAKGRFKVPDDIDGSGPELTKHFEEG